MTDSDQGHNVPPPSHGSKIDYHALEHTIEDMIWSGSWSGNSEESHALARAIINHVLDIVGTPDDQTSVIEELARDADLLPTWPRDGEDFQHTYFGEVGRVRRFRSFADWLRAQQESDHE